MTATTSASAPNSEPLSPEAQAVALWTYVHLRTPRFSTEAALAVVQRLRPGSEESPKDLAKRLRKELQAQGVALKHTHALHAASRLMNFESWHTNAEAKSPRLKLVTFEPTVEERLFTTWHDLADELRGWCDELLAKTPAQHHIIQLNFADQHMTLSTPVVVGKDEQERVESCPLAAVTSISGQQNWLNGAAGALEKVRRHLEETGVAILDGYAVLSLCTQASHKGDTTQPVTPADACNSELVLVREDNEDDPHSGFEIARGDEMTCWHQLELAVRDEKTRELGDMRVTVPVEGVGAWIVNGERYVWQLQTIHPNDYVPGLVTAQLGIHDCERLLRRYLLAKRMYRQGLHHHQQTKQVAYLGRPSESYRVNLHFVLHEMRNAGFTWESYCERFQTENLEMQAELPFGFILQLVDNLKIENPNKVFAQPNRSEMALVEDDSLIRALLPRVNFVRYTRPQNLEPELATALNEAVQDFNNSLRLRQMESAGGFTINLPYLVYASDGEELRAKAEELGLRMYAAAVPHLVSTEGIVEKLPNMWPWATGHALFLRFERAGEAQ